MLPCSPTSKLARHGALVQDRGLCMRTPASLALSTLNPQLMIKLLLLLQEKRLLNHRRNVIQYVTWAHQTSRGAESPCQNCSVSAFLPGLSMNRDLFAGIHWGYRLARLLPVIHQTAHSAPNCCTCHLPYSAKEAKGDFIKKKKNLS